MTEGTDTSEWPACQRRSSPACEGEVDPRRWALGFTHCPYCADGPKQFLTINLHKSSAIVVTDREQLKYAGVKTPRV